MLEHETHAAELKVCSILMASSSFLQFDLDGDGAITSDEMKHAMVKLLGKHTSKNEIDAVVKDADNNGDGTVDFEGKLNKHRPQKMISFHSNFLYYFVLPHIIILLLL